MDKDHEMTESIIGRDGSRDFYVKKVLNRQILIVEYLQYLDRKHLHRALCSAEYGASTMASGQNRMLSVCGRVQLKCDGTR